MDVPENQARAWVRLPSGKRLDLLHPTPFDWEDADLALGMARTYRWGGHSAWPLPLSVAQHCLFVLALRRQRFPNARDARADLCELLHDGEEGLLGFDCISVLKPFLGEAFFQLSENLTQVIRIRYALPDWNTKARFAHKRADKIAAASEAMHVVGWTREEVRHTLRIRFEPLEEDPLAKIYACAAWEPWPPQLAAERFLTELKLLTRAAC
jgi:hypothetical protein